MEADYKKAVSDHMKNAPEQLREYVCGRLKQSDVWEEGRNPILYCGFLWDESKEGVLFWTQMSLEDWQEAMATDFWQSRNQQTAE